MTGGEVFDPDRAYRLARNAHHDGRWRWATWAANIGACLIGFGIGFAVNQLAIGLTLIALGVLGQVVLAYSRSYHAHVRSEIAFNASRVRADGDR